MKKIRLKIAISFIIILISISLSHTSQYQFLFHHYNDICLYSQVFSLSTNKGENLFFVVDASQDASKNLTLSKNAGSSTIDLSIGVQPVRYLRLNLTEKVSNSNNEALNVESKIVNNELLLETIFKPKNWIEIIPYFRSLSSRYTQDSQSNIVINNPGTGKGIKGTLNIRNLGNIESEIGFQDQAISNEKKAIIDASFEKDFSKIILGGNLEGRNILSQYPVLDGKEEKFLESTQGNIFGEIKLFERIFASLIYEGCFKNEIYTLLEGYAGKHNNEKGTYNKFFSHFTYSLNSRINFDINISRYDGKRLYQDSLNNELSTIKTFSPTLTYRPNNSSEIKVRRTIRLSSFTFPDPLTVTDRDILDKSIFFISRYNLPGGTNISLSFERSENHLIYIRSEMSANNVNRIRYNIKTNINYYIPQRIMLEESFSLLANYHKYDFSSDRNLFTRSFAFSSKINILNLYLIQPSIRYRLIKQDWGPYLFSYEVGDYLYYRNIDSKKETYKMDVEIKALSSLSLTPSYTLIMNSSINLAEDPDNATNSFKEEHYSLSITHNENTSKLIDMELTWIKRSPGDNFYEVKTKIEYGI